MPQRDSIVVLTESEAAVVTAATNNDHIKEAIKALTARLTENSTAMKSTRSGPKTSEEFEKARDAAQENLQLLEVLPESEGKAALVNELKQAAVLFGEGLAMHGQGH
ncbi:hypothetical protein HCA61_22435 [Rhodococcus sp. HNM0563]|uniref:hypothetical protein n=1 Tax=Rhodococcus sp. HNM0563 TaxID=2716339 RepID=UPI00146CD6D4|nr:hypothetical protein [Rhodococcus sp. HNM0563]NLU64998.1 hypothetical protein [Rhodococcus sp. HNM0563]